MIHLDSLKKSFGNKEVLKGIDLEVPKGRAIGIVGENGSGKTTLFKCIAGLERHQGKVECELTPLKNHLGFLPTNPYFLPKVTGLEYLRLHCNARRIKGVDLKARNIFQLPLGKYATTYSTGMKKKLALTAILLPANELFILDEPFNGVDIQSNLMITEIIKRLKALGKTILISSHIFSTLTETCDEIHLLREGRLVKRAEPSEFQLLEQEMIDPNTLQAIERLELS